MIHTPLFLRKTHNGMLFLVGLMIFALVLAACGGSSTKAVTKASALSIIAQTNGDYTRIFSPYSSSTNTGAQGMIYEPLLFYNRLDGSIKSWLAVSQQISKDATTVTFNLRQGVKWSDGQPFTSDDVVFTFNMLKQYPAADTNGVWTFLKGVSAPDANTVVVTLKTTFTPGLWYVGGQVWIVPKHKWASVGDASKYADPDPVGTGPYVLKSFTPQNYTLAKNPTYWQAGKPEVNELKFPSFNSNTSAELALDQGKIDWAGLYIPNLEQTYVSRDSAHNRYWFPSSDVVMLYVNTAKPPFNQLAVRQAISAAIDRDQLYKVAESGYEPVASPTGLTLPIQKRYLSPDYANTAFALDPSKSIALLQSAGFTKGSDGIFVGKDGKKLSFSLNVVEGWTDWITGCQILANNLKAIGMSVKVNTISYDAYYSALQMGNYDLSMSWTNPGPSPYYQFDSLLRGSNTAPIGQQANSNWERWSNPATDKLLDQFASSTNTNVQQQALVGLQKTMVEQLPSIPLTNEPYWYEYRTTHFTGWPDAQHPYAVPSPFTFPDCEVVLLNLHPAS